MSNMQTMQKAQPEASVEIKSNNKPERKVRFKTKFNDAEYERWSENLQAGKNGKSKGSGQK